MKKRDKFWIDRILFMFCIIVLFIGVSLYNIIQFNGSYIEEEKAELNIFNQQIEWVVTRILENSKIDDLQKYSDNFKNSKEFSFRVFDENKNLIVSSSTDKTSGLANSDIRLNNNEYNLWELYIHSFQDKSLEAIKELNINNKKYYLETSIYGNSVIDAMKSAQRNIIILFSFCLLMLIIFIIQIFFSIRNSFNTLSDSVLKISRGEFDTQINIPRNGLLEELAISVVSMAQRLKRQIKRLSQLEQYKTEFIQNITHEIKTPITAIRSAVELIEEKRGIPENDKECLDIINFQIDSINKLVGDILALGEIDLKKTEEIKEFQYIDLEALIREVVTYQGVNDCKINVIKNGNISIKANYELLAMAISNILSNAIRYSGSNVIDVIISEDSIEIKDYGVGIEEKHLNRIFERFYRVDKSRSRRKGGTGLGLSIVKNIVELHNWKIKVKSEINKGTSFKILFC